MSHASITDPRFLEKLAALFRNQPEILVLFCYSAAGGKKDFEFYSVFQNLRQRIGQLPPLACVIAFRQPQLPFRGVVDEKFIDECLRGIPDGMDYLLVETVRRAAGRRSWFHHAAGVSRAELRDDLEASRGVPVAAGLYPLWLADGEDVISAIVPDEHGVVRLGAY